MTMKHDRRAPQSGDWIRTREGPNAVPGPPGPRSAKAGATVRTGTHARVAFAVPFPVWERQTWGTERHCKNLKVDLAPVCSQHESTIQKAKG